MPDYGTSLSHGRTRTHRTQQLQRAQAAEPTTRPYTCPISLAIYAFTLSTNSAVHDFWRGAKFENLGDILTAQRTILSKREIKQKLANSHLGLSSASIDYRANQLDKLIKKIPPLIIGAVTKQISPIRSGELICWQPYDPDPALDDSGWRYGRTL